MGNTKRKKLKVKNKSITKAKDLIQQDKKHSYNKTLIVGHPLSDFKVITKLLSSHGMELASPLKKEGIAAEGISDILESTYANDANKEDQLSIDPVWDGLALDLFMSNRKHEWWGWSDDRAILLLDYWKSIDTKMGFVFAYTTPQQFTLNFLKSSSTFSEKSFKKAVDAWCSYHRTLLHFYYRNMDRSLLVNTQQVEVDSSQYLQQINKQLGVRSSKMQKENLSVKPYVKKESRSSTVLPYFIDDLIQEYPMMGEIFEELQSVANLPSKVVQTPPRNPIENIKSLLKQEERQGTLKAKLKSKKKHFKNILKEMEETKVLQQSKENVEKELSSENDLLLTQLHYVQEELEKFYLENSSVKKQLLTVTEEQKGLSSNLNISEEALKEAKEETKVLQQSKEDTEKELSSENDLLLTQLHHVQEELEKYYLENQRLKAKRQEQKRYYGAAERIKKQLSYRLGAKMIEKSHSFWGTLGLPFSLRKVYIEYKNDMKEKKGKKLPPIERYADAYEAERIKGHLSYMLGQTTIKTMKKPFGLFILPFKLIATQKAFKKSRAS